MAVAGAVSREMLLAVLGRDASEGNGHQRRPRKGLDRRLEEVAKAVGGGYCRLQMPLKLALGVRETVAGHRLGARRGGGVPPPSHTSLVLGYMAAPVGDMVRAKALTNVRRGAGKY